MNSLDLRPVSRKRKLAFAAGGAVSLGALAVLFVLPAEFGIDPTGFGAATGLTRVSDPGPNPEQMRGARRKGVFTAAPSRPEPGPADRFEIVLQPYAGIELKYEVAAGKAFSFRWHAAKPLHHDLHAHPFDGGAQLTESYALAEAAVQEGRYTAAFSGIHGWYWQNRNLEPVKLVLDARGALAGSRIFDAGGEQKRQLSPP